MTHKVIKLGRVTDSSPEDPQAGNARPMVFREIDEEVIIQSNTDEVEHFLVLLQASLRQSCDPTTAVLPTLSVEDNQGILLGEVIKYPFRLDEKACVFFIATEQHSRVEVTLSRIAANPSSARLPKQRVLRIA